MLLVVNILLVLVLFANGFFYAKVDKTSINPVTIFSYFWFIMAIVPIVLHAEVDVSPITIIYILLFVIISS